MSTSETIRAAAIIYKGVVYEGGRHQQILIDVCHELKVKGLIVPEKRGFVTSSGRFVSRTEAAQIAWAAGQTYEKLDALYSEEIKYYAK